MKILVDRLTNILRAPFRHAIPTGCAILGAVLLASCSPEAETPGSDSRAPLPESPVLAEADIPGSSPSRLPERLREGDRLPDFTLTDQRGREIGADSFAGSPLLLTFLFTRCAVMDFCPRMSNHFAEIRDEAAADPRLSAELQLLSISFDQEDTPERLAEYGEHFSADPDQWRLATGDAAEIARLTDAFLLRIDHSGGTIDHSLATALVDGGGIIREIWRGNGWTTGEVLEALRSLSNPRQSKGAD